MATASRDQALEIDALDASALEVPENGAESLELTLEEAQVLVDLVQRGMLAAAKDGGVPPLGKAAIAKLQRLSVALEERETILSVRAELETAGIKTDHLSDREVADLGRRISEIPQRPR